MVEEIVGLLRFFPTLLVPEDEVDPQVQVLGHVIRLQCLSQLLHEGGRGFVCPGRQGDIANGGAAVTDPEVNVVSVGEEVALALARHVELWDELFKVGVMSRHVRPRLRDGVKHPIRVVESAVLQAEHALGDFPHEEVEDESGGGVVRAIEESRLRHVCGPLPQRLQSVDVEGAHWLGKITERGASAQVWRKWREKI